MPGRVVAAVVIALALALTLPSGAFVAGVTAAEPAVESADATFVTAYPNPVAKGDSGEFVAVRFDEPTNTTGWTLTDGKTTARLPNRTIEGTVALAVDPEAAKDHAEHPVVPLAGRFRLANDGERLELRANGEPVSSARYRNAPEAERRNFEAERWEPIGATDYEPVRTDGGTATAFVLPDAPDVTVEEFETADDRILVGGYTFTAERIAEALLEAAAEGVTVRVLLDGTPVGGMSDRQARTLDRLIEGGVDVRVLSGPYTRYRYHHAKYAVVDDRAIVSTENFKPAGLGGKSSRGWGIVLEDDRAAATLASLHEGDRTWRAAMAWETYREGRTFTDVDPAVGGYGAEHAPKRIEIEHTTVLVAPDNAADALRERIGGADDRILLQQVRIGSRENRLLGAVLEAAARGVRVRIHLDGSWYVREDNAALIEWLNRRSEAEGWDLEARVDDAEGEDYEKIHTKGVVVDETVILGSLNWDRSAQSNNREALVALEGSAAAAYYAGVFEDDWESDDRPPPAGLFAAVAVATSGVLLLARRLEFVGEKGTVTEWKW